jgi:transposase-like protein
MQIKAGKNHSGSQRYLCKACGESYTPTPSPNGYPEELRKKAILMCLDGQTFRSIARKLGVNHQTVTNWVNNYVAKSARAIYKKPKS